MEIPKLPKYAIENFQLDKILPWDEAKLISSVNHYNGIVKNSCYIFEEKGILVYECKFDICADGSGGDITGGKDTFIANTALHDEDNKALNAWEFPYLVLPLKKDELDNIRNYGLGLGDLAITFWKDKSCAGCYGDIGPATKLGEGSAYMAQQLGINPSPISGGIQKVPPGIYHVAFINSRDRQDKKTGRSKDKVNQDAWAIFNGLISDANLDKKER